MAAPKMWVDWKKYLDDDYLPTWLSTPPPMKSLDPRTLEYRKQYLFSIHLVIRLFIKSFENESQAREI